MSTPTDLAAGLAETILGSVDDAFASNDVETILATLQEPFEEMERRIVVATMVQEAVAKGFLRAIEEESSIQLAGKDMEVRELRNSLKEKDAAIFDLKKVLETREREFLPPCPDDRGESPKQVWEFLHESQQKWQDSEALIEEKERELTKLAFSMAEMASILDNESKRAALLDKQLKDLREQDSTKVREISKLNEEIERLKVAHRSSYSRLKREARLKELKFNESMEQFQAERHKQKIDLGRLLAEKEDMGRLLEENSRAIFYMENNLAEMSQTHQDLTRTMIKETERLSIVEQNSFILEEQIEEQKLMREAEGEILATILEQRMIEMSEDLAQWAEKNQSFNHQHDSLAILDQSSSDDANASSSDIVRRAENVNSESVDIIKESSWKFEVEAMLILIIVEGWNKEATDMLNKQNLELALKNEEILNRDREMEILKQAMEELKRNYARLLSTLRWDNGSPRDEAPAELMPERVCGRRLTELSEHLKVTAGSHEQAENVPRRLKLEEELAGQQLQHDVELDILSEIFKQKYQETIDMDLDSKFCKEKRASEVSSIPLSCDTLRINDSKERSREELESSTKSLEELEAQLESFLELEACRLERIKSGCSTSIAKCEFKLDTLMESLANQVNEMKTKISFVQDAIKQQEWKHNVEDEILVLVLMEAVREMHRKLDLQEISQQSQSIQMKSSERIPFVGYDSSLDEQVTSKHPEKAVGFCLESWDEYYKLSPSKRMALLGLQDKDKVIYLLKRNIEELRKEKTDVDQKLDQRTEELYSLKRQFWKEKEIWISKLSQPKRKEVEKLLRQHSSSLEEEFQKMEAALIDSATSQLRGEWHMERKDLLEAISQKESDMKCMAAELAKFVEKEKSSTIAQTRLSARIAELEMERESLSKERLNQESLSVRWKQEWQSEKDSIMEELAKLEEKEKGHVEKEAHLVASIAEMEKEREALIGERLNQESLSSRFRKEWQTEKECLLDRIQESEKGTADALSKLALVFEKEKSHIKRIAQLESEKDQLITGRHRDFSATSLLEEKEIALALAMKEREEEEKRRKIIEIQLQGLRLEVKSLQGLNEEVACLRGKLESIPTQLESKVAEQISEFLKVSQEFEYRVTNKIQGRIGSLDGIKEKCRSLKGNLKSFSSRESHYKQKLVKELSNLQKAETEVDLLGDEVDSLLNVLEKVYVVFDHYAPVLQHYPRMVDLAKVVKQEIQLRIDPKYGL